MARARARAEPPALRGVMETFVVDWPVLALIGLGFAAAAPRARWWTSRAFAAGAVSALAFTAVALLGYALAPDWMWMYFLPPGDVAWAVPLVLALYPCAFVGAFAAGVALKDLGRGALAAALALAAAAELLVVALTWDRYRLVGTRREWLAGDAHALLTASPEGPVAGLALAAPALAAVVAVAALVAYRSRRGPDAGR